MRIPILLILLITLVTIGASATSAAQVAMVDDAKEKDDPGTCADGYGRSFTAADLGRYDEGAPGTAAFWTAHSSCFGVTSGAAERPILGAMCSDEEDITVRVSTTEQIMAELPELEGWMVCFVVVIGGGSQPVALRADDFELMRNSAGTVAPSEAIAPFVPAGLDLTEPQQVGTGEQAVGLLAFDVEEGWADGDLLLRWWETADVIIVDRTDEAPIQLLAGDPDALQ